ncbi:MAG TPA: hypothetical protein VJ871_04100 [Bacteroidales bacterium]|jgi:hypothetical protein|nr:hypothetical protein [Bacteroidales bacterium]
MKHRIIIFFLFLCCALVYAQKEVYFETIDSAYMKVRSLHGVEVGVLPYKTKMDPFRFDRFSLSGYVGYAYEKAVAPTWTLRFTAGLHTVYGDNLRLTPDNQVEWVKQTDRIGQVGLEPRWHYTFKQRYVAGRGGLNAGWYLGLPLSMELSYNKNYAVYIKTLHLLPTWGYRSSLTPRLYWECAAGVGRYWFIGRNIMILHPDLDYSLRLGLTYTL